VLGHRADERDLSDYDTVLLATGTEPDGIPDGAIDAVRMLITREAPVGDDVTVAGSGTVGHARRALVTGRPQGSSTIRPGRSARHHMEGVMTVASSRSPATCRR
jgi:hypothetical protein